MPASARSRSPARAARRRAQLADADKLLARRRAATASPTAPSSPTAAAPSGPWQRARPGAGARLLQRGVQPAQPGDVGGAQPRGDPRRARHLRHARHRVHRGHRARVLLPYEGETPLHRPRRSPTSSSPTASTASTSRRAWAWPTPRTCTGSAPPSSTATRGSARAAPARHERHGARQRARRHGRRRAGSRAPSAGSAAASRCRRACSRSATSRQRTWSRCSRRWAFTPASTSAAAPRRLGDRRAARHRAPRAVLRAGTKDDLLARDGALPVRRRGAKPLPR